MKLTFNNPFRILGLPLTASARDITKQVNSLATYAEMGKTRSLNTDFSFLPPINRTAEVIEEANKRIEQDENRLLHSLFWFWNNNNVDELAWDVLKEGGVERAIEIWEKAIFANKEKTYKPVALYDNLIRQSTDWYEADDDNHSLKKNDEAYVIQRKAATSYSIPSVCANLSDYVTDWSIECDTEWIDGIDNLSYGIVFGKDHGSYFSFGITANGYYRFDKCVDWDLASLIPWKSSGDVETWGSNHLQITSLNDQLRFYINGHFVDSLERQPSFGNYLGFKVTNAQTIVFSNFKLCWLVEDDAYGAGIKASSRNFSNVKNLSVLFLSLTAASSGTLRQDYLRKGAALANKCFSSEHIEEYVKLVAGDRYVYDPARALRFYVSNVVDSVKQYLDKPAGISTGQLIQTFSDYPIEATQYLNSRFLAKPIRNIEKEIESAQAARGSSPSSAVDVGKSLVEVTKSDIEFLEAALGKSEYQYQNIADKLADEIIQCGIDSFNLTKDDEPCLQLYQYGSSLAVSLRTQERAKENLDSCIGWIENKQAAQRRIEEKDQAAREKEERRKEEQCLESVESRINVVLSSRASAKAKYHLLRNNVIPLLDSIEREKGGNSRPFSRASNSLSRVFKNLARELDQSKDFGLALEAIELASTICCDKELNATIKHASALISQNIHVTPIKNLCLRATATAADHPESADQSARWLVNNSRPLLSELKKVVSSSSSPSDIHDQVVLAALSCHNMYGQATGDVEGCLEIVELILPLAASQSVRSKVVEQIDFAHWYLEQAKSSKTTGQSPAVEQYRLSQEGATGAENPQARAESLHESESPEQTVPYKVRYSESDGVKTLTAQIASIVSAPEPPEQKFFSLLDSILPLVREISQVCGDRSAASRVASESAVNALRDICSELFRELPTRQLAYEALKLAADLCSDPKLKKNIEREHVVLEEYAAEMSLLIDALDDVARPPAVKSLSGTGLVLAGASDYDSKGISHLSNLYLSLFFIRLLPLARYRVIKRKDGSVTFVGKAKLRRIDHLHILFVIAVGTVLLLAFFWGV